MLIQSSVKNGSVLLLSFFTQLLFCPECCDSFSTLLKVFHYFMLGFMMTQKSVNLLDFWVKVSKLDGWGGQVDFGRTK